MLQGKEFAIQQMIKILKLKSINILDRNHEAVRDLEALKNKEDVGLGAMLALVNAHKKFSSVGE